MAGKFNIVAELLLQGPKNLRSVVKDIRTQIGNIQADIAIKVDPKTARQMGEINKHMRDMNKGASGAARAASTVSSNLAQIESSSKGAGSAVKNLASEVQKGSKNLKSASADVRAASGAIQEFGRQSGLAVKRFLAFSIPTGILLGFTSAIKKGFQSAIEFERELIKISQVTGKTVSGLSALTSEITRLSVTFGVASQELLETSRVLSQAGFSAKETKTALEALAKASLAPTFRDMKNTVEGAIAAMRQFGFEADQLEGKLGAINAVASQFAVEAQDIVFAIRRTGGAFKAAGGDLEELIALFTAVRSTTRESAETIATGFRTIFTRLQRPQTIAFLEELGIKLRDAKGQFIGPLESIKKLNAALANVPPTDARFAQIVEQIGGYRQVSKVIPLIQNLNVALAAHQTALAGVDSISQDAAVAQGAFSVQMEKTRQEFQALIRDIAGDQGFRDFGEGLLKVASSFIKLVDAAKPVLPILAAVAGFKAVSGAIQFGKGFLGGAGTGGGAGGAGSQQQAQLTQKEIQANQQLVAALEQDVQSQQVASQETSAVVIALRNLTATLRPLEGSISSLSQSINRMASMGPSRTPGGIIVPGGKGFARGGTVPGSGNRDTVPAMLSPGEFVIRKSAAQAIGSDQLKSMNKYGKGGKIQVGAKGGMDYAGLFLEPTGADALTTEYNYTGSFAGKGLLANKINSRLGFSDRGKGSKQMKLGALSRQGVLSSGSWGVGGDRIGVSRTQIANKIRSHPTMKGSTSGLLDSLDATKAGDINVSRLPQAEQALLTKTMFREGATGFKGGMGITPAMIATKEIPLVGTPGVMAISPARGQQTKALVRKYWEKMLHHAVELREGAHNPFVQQNFTKMFDRAGGPSVEGHAFEAILLALGQDANFSSESAESFDFPGQSPFAKNVSNLFDQAGTTQKFKALDAKRSQSASNISSLVKKGANSGVLGQFGIPLWYDATGTKHAERVSKAPGATGASVKLNATGGSIGGPDTVPSLLTPGEFVINKNAAGRIGAANLEKMNKFNKGGFVGAPVQRFAGGGIVGKVAMGGFAISMITSLVSMQGEVDKTTQRMIEMVTMFSTLLITSQMLNDFSLTGLATKAAENAMSKASVASKTAEITAEGTDTAVTMEHSQAVAMNSKLLKGFAMAAQLATLATMAIAAGMFYAAGKAEDAANKNLGSAKTMEEAAAAASELAGAKKQKAGAIGVGVGAMAGAKIGATIGTMIAPGIGTAVGGIIGTIGGAFAGKAIGESMSKESKNFQKAMQEARERFTGESIDRFRETMSDINAKRASIEGKSLAIKKEINSQEALLIGSAGQNRKQLIKQMKGQISSYFSLGQSMAANADSIDEFKKANNGMGQQLIRFIAKIRGLPMNDVENMFTDMIDQRQKARKAEDALIAAQEKAKINVDKFTALADGLDLAVEAAQRFATDMDTVAGLFKGEFVTPEDFVSGIEIGKDFSNIVDIEGFNRGLDQLTRPFGETGQELADNVRRQAAAATALPDILENARKQAQEPGQALDLPDLVEKELGDFPASLKDVVLTGIKEQFAKDGGRKNLMEGIRKDKGGAAIDLLGDTLETMQEVLPKMSELFIKEAERLAKAHAQRNRLEIAMMDKRTDLLKMQFSRENEIAKLRGRGRDVDFEGQDMAMQQQLLGTRNAEMAGNAQGIAQRLGEVNDAIADTTAAMRRSPEDRQFQLSANAALDSMRKEGHGLAKTMKLLESTNRALIQHMREEIRIRQSVQDKIVSGADAYSFGTNEFRAGMDEASMAFFALNRNLGGFGGNAGFARGDAATTQAFINAKDLKEGNKPTAKQLELARKFLQSIDGNTILDRKTGVTALDALKRVRMEMNFLRKTEGTTSKETDRQDLAQVISMISGSAQMPGLDGAIKSLEIALKASQDAGFAGLEGVQQRAVDRLTKNMEIANNIFLNRFEQILLRQNQRESQAEAKILNAEKQQIEDQVKASDDFHSSLLSVNTKGTRELVSGMKDADKDRLSKFARMIQDQSGNIAATQRQRDIASERRSGVATSTMTGIQGTRKWAADPVTGTAAHEVNLGTDWDSLSARDRKDLMPNTMTTLSSQPGRLMAGRDRGTFVDTGRAALRADIADLLTPASPRMGGVMIPGMKEGGSYLESVEGVAEKSKEGGALPFGLKMPDKAQVPWSFIKDRNDAIYRQQADLQKELIEGKKRELAIAEKTEAAVTGVLGALFLKSTEGAGGELTHPTRGQRPHGIRLESEEQGAVLADFAEQIRRVNEKEARQTGFTVSPVRGIESFDPATGNIKNVISELPKEMRRTIHDVLKDQFSTKIEAALRAPQPEHRLSNKGTAEKLADEIGSALNAALPDAELFKGEAMVQFSKRMTDLLRKIDEGELTFGQLYDDVDRAREKTGDFAKNLETAAKSRLGKNTLLQLIQGDKYVDVARGPVGEALQHADFNRLTEIREGGSGIDSLLKQFPSLPRPDTPLFKEGGNKYAAGLMGGGYVDQSAMLRAIPQQEAIMNYMEAIKKELDPAEFERIGLAIFKAMTPDENLTRSLEQITQQMLSLEQGGAIGTVGLATMVSALDLVDTQAKEQANTLRDTFLELVQGITSFGIDTGELTKEEYALQTLNLMISKQAEELSRLADQTGKVDNDMFIKLTTDLIEVNNKLLPINGSLATFRKELGELNGELAEYEFQRAKAGRAQVAKATAEETVRQQAAPGATVASQVLQSGIGTGGIPIPKELADKMVADMVNKVAEDAGNKASAAVGGKADKVKQTKQEKVAEDTARAQLNAAEERVVSARKAANFAKRSGADDEGQAEKNLASAITNLNQTLADQGQYQVQRVDEKGNAIGQNPYSVAGKSKEEIAAAHREKTGQELRPDILQKKYEAGQMLMQGKSSSAANSNLDLFNQTLSKVEGRLRTLQFNPGIDYNQDGNFDREDIKYEGKYESRGQEIEAMKALLTELKQIKEQTKGEGFFRPEAFLKLLGGVSGFARGGSVHSYRYPRSTVFASRGMFTPRGTDTVPAMLTPGEFVINRQATANNLGLLKSINSGDVSYKADGGIIVSNPFRGKGVPSTVGYKNPSGYDFDRDEKLSQAEIAQMIAAQDRNSSRYGLAQLWAGTRAYVNSDNPRETGLQTFRRNYSELINRAYKDQVDRATKEKWWKEVEALGGRQFDPINTLFASLRDRSLFETDFSWGFPNSKVAPNTGNAINPAEGNRAWTAIRSKMEAKIFDPQSLFEDAAQLYTVNRIMGERAYKQWLAPNEVSSRGGPYLKNFPSGLGQYGATGLFYSPAEFMETMRGAFGGRTSPMDFLAGLPRPQGFARGGSVDNIPAYLSKGEYVVNSRAASGNLGILNAINSGKIQGFQNGGLVQYLTRGGQSGPGVGSLGTAFNTTSLEFGMDSNSASALSGFKEAAGDIRDADLTGAFASFDKGISNLDGVFKSFTGELKHQMSGRIDVVHNMSGLNNLITDEMERNLKDFGEKFAKKVVGDMLERWAGDGNLLAGETLKDFGGLS